MARGLIINGETLVKVKGGFHSQLLRSGAQLGLASEEIRITPRFHHRDVVVDDFGPHVPAEVMAMLADVKITMTLIHFDDQVLRECWSEAAGEMVTDGTFTGAGQLLGRGRQLFASGCHFVSLGLASPVEVLPWRFPACYLDAQPLEYPLGTKATLASLSWRAVPYRPVFLSGTAQGFQEVQSSGVVLWDHNEDF